MTDKDDLPHIPTARRYTIGEIDQMRHDVIALACVANRFAFANDEENERRLRTYILAGVDPDELRSEAQKARKKRMAEDEEFRAKWLREHAEHRPYIELPGSVPDKAKLAEGLKNLRGRLTQPGYWVERQ